MKKTYCAPKMETFKLDVEGVLCLSTMNGDARKDSEVLAPERRGWNEYEQ